MKKNPLLGALPILAKMLGRRLGVRVVIGAENAHTDGATIFLPALPADDAALAALANGYIDHEAAHIRYTDFTAPKPAGLTGELANLLEDIRIERALGADYPGSRDNLAALVAALEAQQPLTPPAEARIDEQVFAGLLTLLRARLLGQTALAPAAATLEARLVERLPEGVMTKLVGLAFTVRQTTSTAEVIALAKRIVAMLEEEAAPASPPSASAGDGGGASPPGSSSASTGDGARTDGARHAALQALLAAAGGSAPDLGDQVRAYLNAQAEKTPASAAIEMAENDPVPPLGCAGDALRADARRATAALRRRLGVLIQAQQQEASWHSRRGRRLATARLYQTALPNPALFARRENRETPDTAITLLLDRSGSMQGRIALACQAVLATSLALDTLPGVVNRVVAFPGSNDDRVIPLKDFTERAHRVAGRFCRGVDGGTPLAPALWRAAYDLLQRPEARRLAIVMTDGAPCHPHTVRDLIARCRAGGIEVIGLGIATEPDLIDGLFGPREGITIGRIEDLAPALFRLLEQRLALAA